MLLASAPAFAANFTKGNLVVLRTGDGTTALSSGTAPISILEFTPAGVPVQTNAIPSSGATALTAAGSSAAEGFITSSPDGKTLVLVGYNLNAGTAAASSTTAAVGRRSVATLSASGNFNIQYTSTATFSGAVRSGATDGSGNFWCTFSSGGVGYMNSNTQIISANTRVANVFNGNLYYDVAGTLSGYTGLPTTAQASTALATGSSLYDFAINTAGTILYLADDSVTTSGGGVKRYDWNGSAWVLSYVMKPNAATTSGANGITADFSGANPVIYGSSGGNTLFKLTDTGSTSAGAAIASSGANYAFRGVRFAPSGAPVITSQPTGQTVTAGNSANYSVTLDAGTSTTSLTYVWKDNNNTTLATHTTASLSDNFTFSNAQQSDSGKQIRVEVTNDLGTSTSDNADLIVNAAGQPAGIDFDIFADKAPIYAGQTVTFEVDATGTTPMTYSWSLNGTPLSNGGNVSIVSVGLSSKVTFTGITAAQAGTIYCGITNDFGGVSSSLPYTVEVPAAPIVTGMNPTGTLTNNAGTSRSITVGASDDSGVLSYQWQKGGVTLSNGSHVNGATVVGATTASLTLTGLLAADAGTYHVLVSNAGGTTDSTTSTNYLVLIVNEPVILTQPKSQVLRQGASTTLTVVAGGTGLSYQWKKDGNNISAATDTALPLNNVTTADTGAYTVNVHSSGTGGDLLSQPAQVVVASSTPVPLAATNLVVLQLGDGSEAASANGNSIYVQQYTKSGTLVSTYAVDNAGADALGITGNSTSEGHLSRANDGQSLAFGAYNAPVPAASSLIASTTVPRAAVKIAPNGAVTIEGRDKYYAGGNMRSVAADGLGNYWGSGNAQGTIYMGTNSPTNTIQTSVAANTRVATVQNGQLYVGFSGTNGGVYAIGTNTPVTGPQTGTRVIPISAGSPYDYVFNPAGTICYVADDTSVTAQLERWDLVGGVWTNSYNFAQGCRSITVDWNGANPVVYGTSTDNKLFSVVDAGASSPVTVLATSAGLFRGVKLAPGINQTINFSAIADAYSCSDPIALNATASSGLPVSYTLVSGPATLVGNTIVITTPLNAPAAITISASQAGDGTYNPATTVTQTFTVNPSAVTVNIPGLTSVNLECHDSYTEPTVTATDSCGNALTVSSVGSVNPNTVGDYTVTYSATDATGATGSATLAVHVADNTKPEVTVTGQNPVNLCLGTLYSDAGATATDNCSTTVNAAWTAGTVDVNVAGSYTLTYTATDDAGNVGSATRVVNVAECGIVINTQPQSQLGALQGSNVTLTVVATSGLSLSYQWYENGSPVLNATGSSYTFPAHTTLDHGTNNSYYVVVANASTSVPSDTVNVTTRIDITKPTFSMTAPANKARAPHFTITGKAGDIVSGKDKKGNAAFLVYTWTGVSVTGTPTTHRDSLDAVGSDPTARTLTAFPISDPDHAGINTLTIWVEDFAGNKSPAQTRTLFWQVPHDYVLTVGGDGTGTIAVTTKGGPKEAVNGAPTGTVVGGGAPITMTVYAYQDYTFKFTPDKKVAFPSPTSVPSVISNVVTQASGETKTTPVFYSFNATDADASATVYFERDRFADMAGNYNAVLTAEPGSPKKESSRYMHITVSKTRAVTGYLLDSANAKTLVASKTIVNANGSAHLVFGSIIVDGSLAWTGSEDPAGVKQFIATATEPTWPTAASVVADREDKTGYVDGQATMQIPNGIYSGGMGGTSFATLTAKKGVLAAKVYLADDQKHQANVIAIVSRSGNIAFWAPVKQSGSLFFGNLYASNTLASLSAPQMSWIRPPNNPVYPSLVPAGFTLAQFGALCSPFDPATAFNGTFRLNISGGNIATPIVDQPLTFASGVATPVVGKVKSAKVDATGKITIVFNDGVTTKSTTTAIGVWLQNVNVVEGYFLRTAAPLSTDAGRLRLDP
jgi:hypothetical protein